MNKTILSTILFLSVMAAWGQELKTSYFMPNSVARQRLNPALTPKNGGYLNLGVLGDLNINFISNGLKVDNLFYKDPSGSGLVTFLHSSVDYKQFLNSIKEDNTLSTSVNMNLLGFGFYSGKSFWSFGVDVKTHLDAKIPKSLFEFVKGGKYDGDRIHYFNDVKANTVSYGQLYLGYAGKVSRRLTIGFKAKFIGGIADAEVHYDQMSLEVSERKWEAIVTSRFDINAAGSEFKEVKQLGDPFKFDDVNLKPDNFGGKGFGLDLGFDYKIARNLSISAAATDFGFIWWDKESNISGETNNATFTYTGFNIGENEDENNLDDLNQLLDFYTTTPSSRKKALRSTINFATECSMFKNKLGLGLLYSRTFGMFTTSELTASLNFRPKRWFSGSISYSILDNKSNTYGLALNFSPSWINLFVGTDYMPTKVTPQFVPISNGNFNIYFGLAIPIGYVKKQRIIYLVY